MKKFCITKKSRIFAANYISKGGHIRLFATGFFCALLLTIYGFVPPCRALMRRLPLDRCSSTGQAEPFFSPPERHFKAMNTAIQTRPNAKNSTVPATAHLTCAEPAAPTGATNPIQLLDILIAAPRRAILVAARGVRTLHGASLEMEYTLNGARYHCAITQKGGQP